jgi:hypothetical protein
MLSRSQAVLRGLLVAATVGACALTLAASPSPLWIAAAILVGLSVWVALHPSSRLAFVLVLGLAGQWLVTVPVPRTTGAWLPTVATAVLVLVVHLSTSLAAALPPQAPLPALTVRRWVRRTALVVAACCPVWAISFAVSRTSEPGQGTFTYAALAGTALLALAVWQASREQRHPA